MVGLNILPRTIVLPEGYESLRISLILLALAGAYIGYLRQKSSGRLCALGAAKLRRAPTDASR
jgi:hypothetical protein